MSSHNIFFQGQCIRSQTDITCCALDISNNCPADSDLCVHMSNVRLLKVSDEVS
jgi:hypothetical protein